MKYNTLLTLAAIYLGLVGLGLLFAPVAMEMGLLSGPAAVLDELRGYGGTLIGIAVINFFSRNSESSKAKNAVFLGNTFGFGLVTITGIIQQTHGAPKVGWLFAVIHAAFAVSFFIAGRASMAKN